MFQRNLLLAALVTGTLLLAGCNFTPVKNSAVVTSVSPVGLAKALSRSLDVPNIEYRWMDSGAPDKLLVTLNSITVLVGAEETPVWTGPQSLTLTGAGMVDLGADIALTDLPPGKIDKIRLHFARVAQIQGTLIGDFYDAVDPSHVKQLTVVTKSAYVFDSSTNKNIGESTATPYSAFVGGTPELADIYLAGSPSDTGDYQLDVASGYTVDPTSDTTLTILVDLSRMLRFDDGETNLGDYAHFRCDSVFGWSVAAFFGEVGKIQGYTTLYDVVHLSDSSAGKDVPGWMTVAFDAQGNFLTGITIGDDDNALTVSKGAISTWTETSAGVYSFDLGISGTTVTGFSKVTSLGVSPADVDWSLSTTARTADGKARFTLEFQTP